MLLIPASCDPISVCYEDDNDLRVDCWVEPKANKISSYEFSWSSGTKESLINTNVSGSSAESQFKDKSYVEELEEPQGYRMTLKGFTDTLPHNTTYMCKISGVTARITVQKGRCAYVCVRTELQRDKFNCFIIFLFFCRWTCHVFSSECVSEKLLLLDRLSAALLLSDTQLEKKKNQTTPAHLSVSSNIPRITTTHILITRCQWLANVCPSFVFLPHALKCFPNSDKK